MLSASKHLDGIQDLDLESQQFAARDYRAAN